MSAATTSLGTYAIPGNVDLPHLWPEFGRDGVHLADGRVVSIGGVRVGFVGGVPLPAGVPVLRRGPWRPYLRTASEYADAVAGLSGAEVLCSHAPPAVPELAYDVIARRFEGPSPALAGFIHANAPRAALFGHVHHPLCGRARVGRTECVNVGYFQRFPTDFYYETLTSDLYVDHRTYSYELEPQPETAAEMPAVEAAMQRAGALRVR